jgi:hypothetical protein
VDKENRFITPFYKSVYTDFKIVEHIMAKVGQNLGRQEVPDEVNIFIKVKEGIEKPILLLRKMSSLNL